MIEYPKMKTLFKLIPANEKGSKWSATSGEILPETAPLHYIPLEDLVFTEKIDGTNMAIRLFDADIQKRKHICNRNDKGDSFYFEIGDKIFDNINKLNITDSETLEALHSVIIYGELCGVKIQKGGNYFPERRFLIFDMFDTLENKFFTWSAVKHFADILNLQTVPEITYTKENLNVENVKDFIVNLKSVFNPDYNAEGAVIRYATDTCADRRWMAKIRKKDFR